MQEHPLERPLAILRALSPDDDADDLRALSVGRRDGALLTLREAAFGYEVSGVVECESCGQELELSFDTRELGRRPPEPATASTPSPGAAGVFGSASRRRMILSPRLSGPVWRRPATGCFNGASCGRRSPSSTTKCASGSSNAWRSSTPSPTCRSSSHVPSAGHRRAPASTWPRSSGPRSRVRRGERSRTSTHSPRRTAGAKSDVLGAQPDAAAPLSRARGLMADFATNLAARALGVATTVRPRPASRFETELLEEPNAIAVPRAPRRPLHESNSGLALPEPPPGVRGRLRRGRPSPLRSARCLRSLPPRLLERPVCVRTDAAPPPPGKRVDAAPRGEPCAPRPGRAPVVVRAVAPAAAAASPPAARRARRDAPSSHPCASRSAGWRYARLYRSAPPAPVPKPATQLLPLSLEEYLDQRRSGRR